MNSVGPRKLAQALSKILERRDNGQGNNTPTQTPSDTKHLPHRTLSTPLPRNPSKTPALPAATSGPMALLVDDNLINLRLLAGFMKKIRIPCRQALNGQEALDAYTADPAKFQVVFMDISMPVMNGVVATQRIRQFEARSKLPRAPIIALTGLASAAARNEAQEAGMDDYLTKPLNFGLLKGIVDRHWLEDGSGKGLTAA